MEAAVEDSIDVEASVREDGVKVRNGMAIASREAVRMPLSRSRNICMKPSSKVRSPAACDRSCSKSMVWAGCLGDSSFSFAWARFRDQNASREESQRDFGLVRVSAPSDLTAHVYTDVQGINMSRVIPSQVICCQINTATQVTRLDRTRNSAKLTPNARRCSH